MLKLYLDTSALVKLLVEEQGSDAAATLAESATEIVSASIGYVEARWALGKAQRERRLERQRPGGLRVELERLWDETNVVDLDRELIIASGDVAEHLALRAGDAIHLATAMALDEPELIFVTWDARLARAAREIGLAVAP